MHKLKALLPFQPIPEVRSTVEMITPTGQQHLQPRQQNPRARKQERECQPARPESVCIGRGIILSQRNTFYYESDFGNRFVTRDVFTGTATGPSSARSGSSTPSPPPRASARPRGPLHHGATRQEKSSTEARNEGKKATKKES